MKEQQTHNNINPTTKTPKRVPKLRFPEFIGKWHSKTLGEIGNVAMCKRIMKDQTTEIGEIPFFKIGTFGKTPDAYISESLFQNFKKKYSFPKKGDILISASGTIGRTVVYDGKPAYFQDSNIVWIDNDENQLINSLLVYIYENVNWNTENTTIARLYNNNLRSINITFPEINEQQKIASFLSAVDKKITQLQQKKHLLEQYKKGVMQQLFSQKLRFKPALSAVEGGEVGNDYPDWEEKKLGEILDYEQPTNYLVSSTEYSDDYKTPVLTAGKTFILGYTDETDNIFKDELPVIIFDDFTTATQFVDFPFKAKSSAMKILKAKKSENIKFIYESMQNIQFEIGGHGRHWISKFSVMKIPYPCLEEQTKIANFLSAIDTKIALVNTQIENTQQFKKGLLQQMFV